MEIPGQISAEIYTLSVEALFYALFPFIFAKIRSFSERKLFQFAQNSSLFFMYFPLFRVPEFAFGVAAGILFSRTPPVSGLARRFVILVGWIGFVVGFWLLEPLVPGPMISNGLLMPFLALLLVGLAYSSAWMLNHSVFVQLGEASYSLYLLHIPLLAWMGLIDRRQFHLQEHHPNLFFVIYLALTIVASLASLHFVEIPARLALRQWMR
jgi:peptidoglycan/LPS O-acetylase OafA/YrhL